MKTLAALLLAFLLYVPASRAQSGPEQGGNELELWSGGGHNVSGGAANIGAWNVGPRKTDGPCGPVMIQP